MIGVLRTEGRRVPRESLEEMVLQPQTWARISTPYGLTCWPHVVTCKRCSPFPAGFFRRLRGRRYAYNRLVRKSSQQQFQRGEDHRSPSPGRGSDPFSELENRGCRHPDSLWLWVAGEIVRKAETGTSLHDGPWWREKYLPIGSAIESKTDTQNLAENITGTDARDILVQSPA